MSEWIKEITSTGKPYLFNPRTGNLLRRIDPQN